MTDDRMTERDLDDLWAVAFKLRDVLVLLENQLSGKDGGAERSGREASPQQAASPVPANQLSGKDGSHRESTGDTPLPPVPANPAGGGTDSPASSTSPPTGGGFYSPEDGLPLQYGDFIEDRFGGGKYFAGPCYVCGKAALTKYKPGAGKEGQHRCWPCFKEAGR